MKILNLCENKIADIKLLEKVKFKQLNIINLNDNKIPDIKVLKKVYFNKFRRITLKWKSNIRYKSIRKC